MYNPAVIPCFLLLSLQTVPPINLQVDATNSWRGVYRVVETMPARQIISFPKYLPGHHMPDGNISGMTGLKIEADGRPVSWRRDGTDMFTFYVDLPLSAKKMVLRFNAQHGVRSPNMARLDWESCIFLPYPNPSDSIPVQASVQMPKDWMFATALTASAGSATRFKTVSATELIDSPIEMGRFTKSYDLGSIEGAPVSMFVATDHQETTEMPESTIEGLKRLVQQAGLLYNGRHFRKYIFLVTGSGPGAGGGGLEHHECCEDSYGEKALKDRPDTVAALAGHEFTHSWNGKYRRPFDLATPNYDVPMKDDLLWVYEGLTEYLGDLLAARSGLVSKEGFCDTMASYVIDVTANSGRSWRSLEDTATGLDASMFGRSAWNVDARGGDYYEEGGLTWMEADCIIRKGTQGNKSLKDFLRVFVGGVSDPKLRTYDFQEVVSDLNKVYPYDWAGFFRDRVYRVAPGMPVHGITRAGYEVIYNANPMKGMWNGYEPKAMLHVWGAHVDDSGNVTDVAIDSPAYKGGLAPGMHVSQINGKPFTATFLHEAISSSGMQTMELSVEQSGFPAKVNVTFKGYPYEPHLSRISSEPDLISMIVAPLKP